MHPDWKGGAKKKQVNIDIDLKGVTVTRVQSKKKDPKVGSWDWYHIKSWDVAKTHFGFKIVGADGAITDYIFETTQVCARLHCARLRRTGSLRLTFGAYRRKQLQQISRIK